MGALVSEMSTEQRKEKMAKEKRQNLPHMDVEKVGGAGQIKLARGCSNNNNTISTDIHMYIHTYMYVCSSRGHSNKKCKFVGHALELAILSLFSLIPSFYLLAPTFLGLGLPPG